MTSRRAISSVNEVSDVIRVINTFLTGLDKLRTRPNILVMTTSNLVENIDGAFLDRVDIKQYIGLPEIQAIYTMLRGCVLELIRCGIIIADSDTILPYKEAITLQGVQLKSCSSQLLAISATARGLSGRSLRRLPLLMHSLHLQREVSTINDALEALLKTVKEELDKLMLSCGKRRTEIDRSQPLEEK